MGDRSIEDNPGEIGSEGGPQISDAIYKGGGDGSVRNVVRRLEQWFLLTANRWLVVGLLLAGIFTSIVLVGAFGPVSVRQFVVAGVSSGTTLVELLKTIVSVVTIVLSINSLVLSPQLGPVDNQREILNDAMSLRENAEDILDAAVAPSSPGKFLQALAAAVGMQARVFENASDEDGKPREELRQYAENVTGDANRVATALQGEQFGKFEALPVVMNFNTSGKIRGARRIRREHSETLSDIDHEALEELVDTLELFVTARAYLKTIYIRSEFINFSRALLYTGLPSLLLSFLAIQIYGPGVFPGTTFGVANQLWFVSGAVTVTLVPVTVLISYTGRLATLAQSTLFLAPFVAGEEESDDSSG
jgi:uncharacterized membrane protein